MSQPSFYIFGVPNGFDLLDGDLAATNYFQNYYNPSKENTKFSIHRNAGDGMITYAYLKYNLTSGRGREGSFFGMALVFTENSCCTDFLKLYRLFDTIYDKVILADGEILEPTDGTSYIQAKYKITRFNEKREYIMQKVLPNLLSNLNTFADAFIPIDDTFNSNQPDLGVRIPYENADNKKILNALRQYNRLSISPDWDGPEPPPEIPEEVLYRWHREVPELSLYVNKCFQNISKVNVSEIRKKFNQCSKICETFKTHTYPKDANEDVIQCYNETKEQYLTLYKSFKSLITQIEDIESPPPPPPPPPPTPQPIPWWKNPKIIGIAGGALIVVILMTTIGRAIVKEPEKGEGSGGITVNKQDSIIQRTRTLIAEKQYEDAIRTAEDITDKGVCKHLQDSASTLQDDDYIEQAKAFLTQKNEYAYSDAYNNFISRIKNKNKKEAERDKLVSKWDVFIEKQVKDIEKSKNKTAANNLKNIINDPIKLGQYSDKRPSFETRLNAIINYTGRTDSGHSTGKPQYRVVVWKSNNHLNIENDIDYIYNDSTIKGEYWIYCLEKKNPGNQDWARITGYNVNTSDNAALKRTVPGCKDSSKWGVRLSDDSGEITISCERFRCKITINK